MMKLPSPHGVFDPAENLITVDNVCTIMTLLKLITCVYYNDFDIFIVADCIVLQACFGYPMPAVEATPLTSAGDGQAVTPVNMLFNNVDFSVNSKSRVLILGMNGIGR